MGPLLLAALLAAETPSPGPQPPDSCRPVYELRQNNLAQELQQGDWTHLEADLTAIEDACDHRPVLQLVEAMRAEMRLRQGQPAKALEVLDASPVTISAQLAAYASWVRLGALEALGRTSDLLALRNKMVAANDAALADAKAAYGLHKVERIETPTAVIEAYQGEARQGPFIRRYVFTATPKAAGLPATLTLTSDPTANLVAPGAETYFFDLYMCGGQGLLGQTTATKGQAPDYQAVKAKALAGLADVRIYALKGPKDPPRVCAFPEFILPGLVPPPAPEPAPEPAK